MLSVEHARWGQTPEDLRRLAMSAPHRRTRERFLALHEITRESGGATRVALRAGRHPQTVMGWLHAYNAHGPDALAYRRTGGRPPFVPASRPASARSFAPPSAPPPPRP
jgi:transposase